MPASSIPVVAEDFLQRNGGIVYRNLIGNPVYEANTNGQSIFSSSGSQTGPTRVAESMGESFAAASQVAGATANGSLYIFGNYGTINSFVPVTGKRMALRGRAKVQGVSGGTISNIQLTARVMNNVGTVLTTQTLTGGTNSTVTNPVAGTLYDMSGYFDTTALLTSFPTAAHVSLMYVVNFTTGVTIDVRTTQMMICEIPTASTTIPSYFDGGSQYANWEGAEHASTSVIYAGDGLPLSPGYTVTNGPGVFWVDSKAQLTSLGTGLFSYITPTITPISDNQVVLKGYIGEWSAAGSAHVLPVRIDNNNFLHCRLFVSSQTLGALGIISRIASVDTQLVGTSTFTLGAIGSAYWIVGSIVGNLVTFQYYVTDPALPSSTPAQQISYTLTGTPATTFGSGVKSRPSWIIGFTGKNWKVDRLDVYEYTRPRYWTGVTKQNYKFASRAILADAPVRALLFHYPNGSGEAVASIYQAYGWDTTTDKTGDATKASIISKVLSGGYQNLVIDAGYAAVSNGGMDAAYELWDTYGINVFTSGNDTGASGGYPLFTSTPTPSGLMGQLTPVIASLVDHPITKAWGDAQHSDGDSRAYLAGLRPSVTVVGDYSDQTAGGARRPAIIAEEHQVHGARIIHCQPYNWAGTPKLREAMISWIGKSPRAGVDIIYEDESNFLSENEVLAARAAGLVISDSSSNAVPLNFRRFQRSAGMFYDSIPY